MACFELETIRLTDTNGTTEERKYISRKTSMTGERQGTVSQQVDRQADKLMDNRQAGQQADS